jgi:hypothetical protein
MLGLPPQVGASIGGKVGGKIGGKIDGGGEGGMNKDDQTNATLQGIGLAKTLMGKKKEKEADAALPQREDPEERMAQRQFARQKRAFQTGTAMNAQRASLERVMKGGMEKSVSAGGGARGLNMMRQMFQQSMLGTQQQQQTGALQYAQEEGKMTSKIADRKLQLGLLRYNTLQARAAQQLKEGKQTSNLALARSLGISPGDTMPEAGYEKSPTKTAVDRGQGAQQDETQ